MNSLVVTANPLDAEVDPPSGIDAPERHRAVWDRPCAVQRQVANDADEHAHNLSEWRQLYDQLSRGRFVGTLTEIWVDGAQLFLETTSHALRQSCVVWPDAYWFGIPRGSDARAQIGTRLIDADCVAVRPGNSEFELLTPDEFDILGVVVDANAVIDYARDVEHVELNTCWLGAEVLHIGAVARQSLATFVECTLEQMKRNPQVGTHAAARMSLRQTTLCAVTNTLCGARAESMTVPRRVNRYRLVAQVRDFIVESRDATITVPDLCRRFSVSRRTLQNCFQEVLNTSPASYLRTIRLNAVRRELRNPDSRFHAVQDIAAAWGFWHLSQFASDYKRQFGERPSEAFRSRGNSAFRFICQ